MNRAADRDVSADSLGMPVARWLHRPRLGTVHSVFEHAINIRLDDELLVLTTPDVGVLPNGVVLGAWDLRQTGVVHGQSVAADRDSITVAAAALRVGLGRAAVVGTLISARGVSSPQLRAGVERARRAASARAPVVGLGPVLRGGDGDADAFAGSIMASLAEIRRAALSGDLARVADTTTALVGVGWGLTPSGDDVLVGMTAVLRAMGETLAETIAGAAAAARSRTTLVAGSLLSHAAAGDYAQRVQRAVNAIVSDVDVAPTVANTLRWGASSGADLLVGILVGAELGLGLRAAAREAPARC